MLQTLDACKGEKAVWGNPGSASCSSVIHLVMEIHFYSIKLKHRFYVLTASHILLYSSEKCHVFQSTELSKACYKAFQTDVLSRSSVDNLENDVFLLCNSDCSYIKNII